MQLLRRSGKGRKGKGAPLSSDTKLCSALVLGQTRLAEHLIRQNRANPNIMSPDGFRPLHYAVQLGDNDFMRFLLDEGADPTAYDRYGLMPIHMIVRDTFLLRDTLAMLSLLLDKVPTHINYRTSSIDDNGPMVPRGTRPRDKQCLSPLQLALRRHSESPKLVQFLLDRGADTRWLEQWERDEIRRMTSHRGFTR